MSYDTRKLEDLLRRARCELGFSLGELIKIEGTEFRANNDSGNAIQRKNYWRDTSDYLISIAHQTIDDTGSNTLCNRLLELGCISAIDTFKGVALFTGLDEARSLAMRSSQEESRKLMPQAIERIFFPENIEFFARPTERSRFTLEKTITSDAIPYAEDLLGKVKRSMLVDINDRIFSDRQAPSTVLKFDFSYRGYLNRHGLEIRRSKFYPGFPDLEDWSRFGENWREWSLVIRLEAIEVV